MAFFNYLLPLFLVVNHVVSDLCDQTRIDAVEDEVVKLVVVKIKLREQNKVDDNM